MQHQIEGRSVVSASAPAVKAEVFTDLSNTKYYVKAFLVDDSLNINKWQVTKESIDKNINTFIGKPLVLTENFDHPGGDQDTLNHWLAYQESFRVGTIIDITTKPNPAIPNSTVYYAIIEVTDENLKQALRDNKVPLYVSPAIAEPLPLGASYTEMPPRRVADNWIGVHLAIVDQPAFGIKKAVITDQCGGSEKACLLQLRKAHVQKFGIGNCGFCTKKALQKYAILQQLGHNFPNNAVVDNGSILNTSHTFRTASVQTSKREKKMSQLESINNNNNDSTSIPANNSNNNNRDQNDVTNNSTERVERFERPAVTKQAIQTTTPSVSNNNNNNSYADVYQENQKLRQENQLLHLKIGEQTDALETLTQEVAVIKQEARMQKIAQIITPDIIKDDKKRLEKINYFVGTSLPIDQIEELYKELKIQKRTASSVNQRGRVPYYSGTALGAGTVASSGNSNNNTVVDEETGLTPLQKQLAVLRGGP
jgi:hypothetical protein